MALPETMTSAYRALAEDMKIYCCSTQQKKIAKAPSNAGPPIASFTDSKTGAPQK
jgi:hypothetical protein